MTTGRTCFITMRLIITPDNIYYAPDFETIGSRSYSSGYTSETNQPSSPTVEIARKLQKVV